MQTAWSIPMQTTVSLAMHVAVNEKSVDFLIWQFTWTWLIHSPAGMALLTKKPADLPMQTAWSIPMQTTKSVAMHVAENENRLIFCMAIYLNLVDPFPCMHGLSSSNKKTQLISPCKITLSIPLEICFPNISWFFQYKNGTPKFETIPYLKWYIYVRTWISSMLHSSMGT